MAAATCDLALNREIEGQVPLSRILVSRAPEAPDKMKSTAAVPDLGAWQLFKRYAQFCVVGGSGVVVDMGVIWLLASPGMLDWNLTVSKLIAAEMALINNFVWNELWTFRELSAVRASWRQRLIRLLKFNLICAAGIWLSVLLLNAQVQGLGWNVYVANFNAIVLVSIWNFLLNLKFGWAATTPRQPEVTCHKALKTVDKTSDDVQAGNSCDKPIRLA